MGLSRTLILYIYIINFILTFLCVQQGHKNTRRMFIHPYLGIGRKIHSYILYVDARSKTIEQYSGKCVHTKPRQIGLQRPMKKFVIQGNETIRGMWTVIHLIKLK